MSSQVFYRKWRPRILSEVVGQEQVTRTLLNALASGRVSHAYLFCGPRGTGKTSTGRILAKAVNCLNNGKGEPCDTCAVCEEITGGRSMDVIEIDAASNRGIDEIRDLREKVGYAPARARYKVYIIDEVHMLTTAASNALLKTLEEPPPHAIFILATTEVHQVLPTILSRCQHFDFHRISQADVAAKLGSICQAEGIKMAPDALRLIARATTGSLRDAENLLQQLTTYYGNDIELKQVQNLLGITGDSRARELAKYIINKDTAAGINTINKVSSDGVDLRQFNREVIEYLRMLLLIKTGSGDAIDLTAEDKKEIEALAVKGTLPQIIKAVKLFGQLDIGFDTSTLPMELALVDCTMPVAEERKAAAPKVESRPPVRTTTSSPKPSAASRPVVKTAAPKVNPQPATPPAATAKADPPAPKAAAITSIPLEAKTEIDRLKFNWRQLLKDAPESIGRTPAAALLRSARPKSVEDNTVVISFKFPMYKDKMEMPDNQKIGEKILSDFLGRPCQLRCIHEPEDNHLVKAALEAGAKRIGPEEA